MTRATCATCGAPVRAYPGRVRERNYCNRRCQFPGAVAQRSIEARNALAEAHLYLVPATRRKVYPTPPPRIAAEDLEGAGFIALLRAAERWDPERGVQFTCYAISSIRGAMLEFLRQEDWLTRTARSDTRAGGEGSEGGEVALTVVSLDELVFDDGEARSDYLTSPLPTPEEALLLAADREEREALPAWLEGPIASLSPIERGALIEQVAEGRTMENAAAVLGSHTGTVRSAARRALARVRAALGVTL